MNLRCALLLVSVASVAPAGGQAPAWRLVRGPTIALPTAMTRPRSTSVLPDGHYLMLDTGPPYIYLIDPTGRSVRSFVGRGEGPGHATSPVIVGYLAGQIWLWDAGTKRMSYFDLQGKLLREVPLHRSDAVVPLGANRFATIPITYFSAQRDSVRAVTVGLVDSMGRSRGRLYSFTDWVPILEVAGGDGQRTIGGQPYVRGASTMCFPFGNGIAVGFPNVERRGSDAAFRLVRMDQSGRMLFDGWVKVPGVRVTNAHVSEAVSFLTSRPGASDPAYAKRIRGALRVPAFLPAFSSGLTGANGETWLRNFTLGPDGRGWFVVSAHGAILGRITLPAGELLVSLAPDGGIVTIGEDASGEPTMTRYRVERQ